MYIQLHNGVQFIKQNDTGSQVQFQILGFDKLPYDLTDKNVEVVIGNEVGRLLVKPATILDATDGIIEWGLDEGDLLPSGTLELEVHIYELDGDMIVAPSKKYYKLRVEQAIDELDVVVTTYTLQFFMDQAVATITEIGNMEQATAEAVAAALNATTAANTASGAAVLATDAATLAELRAGQAQTATTEANTARDNANNATTLANNAASAASTAAQNADDATALTQAAIDGANTARDAANLAASGANDKALLAEQKAGEADLAAQNANNVASRLVRVGEYQAGTTYQVGNEVGYNGSSYVAIAQTTGNLPTNTDFWALRAQRGVDGEGSVSSVNNVFPDVSGNVTLDIATDWTDLTGKPTTFPPSAHNHVIGDVTGLQNELDEKALASTVTTLQTEVTTHKQDLASQAAGKGASLIGVQDVDGLFNATTVEGALKEAKEKADLAFQTGNNVKVDMVAALLAVDPTLLITENSSWSEIETATGQISTGLEEASGSATQQADNTLIVTGLNFQPKIIELRFYNSSNGAKYISIYNVNDPNNFNINSMLTGYSGSSNQLFGVSSWDISASGFSCLIGVNIGTFKWFAWG